jgi:ABC-type nickel/cobalt efflux system permease component RcnA
MGLSFAYGVFHAAGPGHGKAVISSYMLANEVQLRRGILLSFLSAGLQAVTAIVVMGLVFLLLRGTSVSMNDAARFLEIASYALIAGFGAWLLWRKLKPLWRSRPARAHSLSAAHVHDHGHDHHGQDHHDHHHAPGEACSCGHSHAPDPMALSGERFDWKSAWSAVAAVGIRPCSGALIVLTFAFLNGLWLGGIASVFAMALGTAITVSALAIVAVTAKNWAVTIAGGGNAGARIHQAIEIAGAAFILLIGLTLLSASLAA